MLIDCWQYADMKLAIPEKLVDEMPWQTLAVVCMHAAGISPRKKMTQVTYQRHKALAKAYGFDIGEPACKVKK